MNGEPDLKRAIAFVDGQNLFHAAREAFGYTFPNYDVTALAREICAAADWELYGPMTSPCQPTGSRRPILGMMDHTSLHRLETE